MGNVPLYLTARGLTTSLIWGGRALRGAILDFLRSTYQAEASRLGWDPGLVTEERHQYT